MKRVAKIIECRTRHRELCVIMDTVSVIPASCEDKDVPAILVACKKKIKLYLALV